MKAVVLSVFAALALLVGLLAALVFYPFAPFGISNHATTPDQVCPLANVGAVAEVSVEGGWDLKKLTIDSTWEPVGDNQGLPVSGGIATILEPSPELANSSKSPVLRIAPEAPGLYGLHSKATVIGTFSKDSLAHGWPKVQVFEYNAKNTLKVMTPENPQCKGAA